MSLPRVPPLHDVVRLTVPTSAPATEDALRRHLDRGPASFNYEHVRGIAPRARIRQLPRAEFVSACMRAAWAKGRAPNAEVAGIVWDFGGAIDSQIFVPERRFFNIRSDFSIPFQPDAFFIESGRVVFFWLQPRKGFALTYYQIRVIVTVLRRLYIVGDFEGANLEILDCRAIDNERVPTRYRLADLEPVTQQELDALFQIFVDAWMVVTSTYQPRPVKRREIRPDPNQGGLFK